MAAALLRPLLLAFLAVFLSLCFGSHASDRTLLVSIDPNKDPITVPFDPRLAINSSDIDASDSRVKKQSSGCQTPEQVSTAVCQRLLHENLGSSFCWPWCIQGYPACKMLPLAYATMHPPLVLQVRLTFWSDTAVLVSWASCDAKLGQNYPVSTDSIRSVVSYGTSSGKLDQKTEGVATSYAYDYTALKGKGINYASPVLHHVQLKGKPCRALCAFVPRLSFFLCGMVCRLHSMCAPPGDAKSATDMPVSLHCASSALHAPPLPPTPATQTSSQAPPTTTIADSGGTDGTNGGPPCLEDI